MTTLDAPRSIPPSDGARIDAGSGAAPAASTPAATVAIAATFTIEGLAQPLAYMLDAAGIEARVDFAPYNQVFQELLSAHGTLGGNAAGANVVALRLEDFARDAEDRGQVAAFLQRTAIELLDAAGQFARRSTVPTIFVVMAPSPTIEADLRAPLETLTGDLEKALAKLPQVSVVRARDVDRLCDTPRDDAVADRIAHAPYTDDYLGALAIALTRRLHLLRVAPHKVLVLDCDNTIWRGVVGEDGVQGIGLDDEFLAVQRFAVDAQAAGALVCLASKNAEADVLEVFDARPDMVLAREHIVAHRINWEHKSANLRALARELNLGLDAFVFLDDNPIECGAMQEAVPEVVTLQLPPPGHIASFLRNLWTFDKASVTQEDQQRTAMYRQNAARESLEANTADIGEFLASLELKIEIAPPTEDEWPRMAQLTHRTNQFNFTTRRRSEAEMRALVATHAVYAVHVSDRFGNYGLVGALVAKASPAQVEVDTFLLSCRVLGRGVEHAMVARLGQLAVEHGAPNVALSLIRTPKNEPALAFANSVVAAFRQDDGATVLYTIPAAFAAAVKHRAGEDAAEVIAARRADAAKPARGATAAPAARAVSRSTRYARLARELTTGAALTAAWRAGQPVQERTLSAANAPRSATERSIAALWEEILGIRGIGLADDFFALGGTSLQAARMIAEVAHRRGVSLPLTTIIEAPTVEAFSQRVDRGDVAVESGLVPLRLGGARKLFLVHDGDGETLLYRNLARRAPADLSVYGIQPQRKSRIPLAHTTIEAMAAAYIGIVREAQPHGPYLIGGMCAGGLISFEMARQLQQRGEAVDRVFLLDAAIPTASRKAAPADAQRSSRLRSALKAAGAGKGALSSAVGALGVLGRKVGNVVAYETGKLMDERSNRKLIGVLEKVLSTNGEWPSDLPSLDFRAIYNHAEGRYVPGATTSLKALLVRARTGTGNDMPYVDVFEDPTFGWDALVGDLAVVDVDGGHSSMLQEPHAESLASALRPHLDATAAAATPARARAAVSDVPA